VKMPETYIRGNIVSNYIPMAEHRNNQIKYLRVPEELLDVIKEDRQKNMDMRYRNQNRQGGRGGHGGHGGHGSYGGHGGQRGGRGGRGGGGGGRNQQVRRFQ
jgi:U6 snRNA-associated Sm-like protein LSm4